jgi:hypothetical protein
MQLPLHTAQLFKKLPFRNAVAAATRPLRLPSDRADVEHMQLRGLLLSMLQARRHCEHTAGITEA